MNRHPRFARRTAGSRHAVSHRLAAIAALLFVVTVGAAVQTVDPRSWSARHDFVSERYTTLRAWRDANRVCSLYKTVGDRRGWSYSDSGLTSMLLTRCVRSAGARPGADGRGADVPGGAAGRHWAHAGQYHVREPIGSPSAHGA
jgi:hypothetical protein